MRVWFNEIFTNHPFPLPKKKMWKNEFHMFLSRLYKCLSVVQIIMIILLHVAGYKWADVRYLQIFNLWLSYSKETVIFLTVENEIFCRNTPRNLFVGISFDRLVQNFFFFFCIWNDTLLWCVCLEQFLWPIKI